MRNFRLMYGIGPDGQTGEDVELYLYLDGTDGFYLFDPEGLGYSESVSAGKVVSGFSKKTHTEIQWPNITGTLYITKMTDAKAVNFRTTDYGVYDAYTQFMKRVHSADHLYLDYCPNYSFDPEIQNVWFRTEVALMSIDKSEITTGDTLQCKMTFARLTPWFKEWELEVTSISVSDWELNVTLFGDHGPGVLDPCYRLEITDIPECDYLELWIGYKKTATSDATKLGACCIYPTSGKFTADNVSYSSNYNDVYVKVNGINAMDQVDVSKNILLRGNAVDYPDEWSPLHITIGCHNPTVPITKTMKAKAFQSDYYRSV